MADGKYEAVALRGAPHQVVFDALNRMIRTWWQAVGAGVLVAIGDLGLRLLLSDDPLGGDFWLGLLRGLIVAILTATFAYFARFKTPPPAELTVPATEVPVPTVVNVYPAPGQDVNAAEAIRAAQKTDPPDGDAVL